MCTPGNVYSKWVDLNIEWDKKLPFTTSVELFFEQPCCNLATQKYRFASAWVTLCISTVHSIVSVMESHVFSLLIWSWIVSSHLSFLTFFNPTVDALQYSCILDSTVVNLSGRNCINIVGCNPSVKGDKIQ
jgi:hypothetical protein